MCATRPRETDLYLPVKALLEGQGYVVKGEIGAADIVAVRDGEEPVVVELKTGFSLSLFHQGIERQSITDAVYIAVPRGTGRHFHKAIAANTSLCRRLGLGLMTVRLKDGLVEVHADPLPYKPRKSIKKRGRLLREFARRTGDPNSGGATRQGLMTAYRQDALRCARVLSELGPTKAALVAKTSGVDRARTLMADNHYGWFERVATGIYGLCPKGAEALQHLGDPDAGPDMPAPAKIGDNGTESCSASGNVSSAKA
ncbi:DUF2161 family putative PD-(D/E)XK-type phosphodiesterase [Hoeflea sp. YIM 152468]|uniref:DUF2161 domain-containing phosphodiesterase n=1 Tax=Hoeflea sp. YIM 152468 TaxID=3031759 RepID=UPI0023DB7F88|nr:DUF2161 family putative PD-(D/E)XK-type phosphodiesterase [Hoeflea sp. YIM 152468]MDF1607150.1 DUF2161 family putative PD-(D/E)XK-type phosphodiesterase [Hoeflea sp. YIM 152468]